MPNAELQQFILERLQALDPTMDTSLGSPAYQQVVEPILAKLGEDPFSVDTRTLLLARMAKEYPELDVTGAGSALSSLLIAPMQLMLEPFRRELTQVRLGQSLAQPNLLSDGDADALLANVFATRQDGEFAEGSIRVYFPDKRSFSVDSTVVATSVDGLSFYVSEYQTFSAIEVGQNVEDGLYYVDLTVRAAEAGDAYNIGKNEILGISGIAGVVRVTNKLAFDGGIPRESTIDFVSRAKSAVAERSPNTDAGVANKLMDRYPSLRAVRVIGYGDPEMQRDIIRGTVSAPSFGLGPLVGSGSDGASLAVVLGLPTLTLPDKTNRMTSAGADFTELDPGDAIHVKDLDRGISEISGQVVTLDDFQVIATGTSGYTTYYSPIGSVGVKLIYTDYLYDNGVNFLSAGVSAGDWLRVDGTWDPPTMPSPTMPPPSANKPGNVDGTGYFQILSVQANKVAITPWLYSELLLESLHIKNGYTGAGNAARVELATLKVTLDAGATPAINFTSGYAAQAGDFISLFMPGMVDPQEWEIDTPVLPYELTLVAGSSPTDYMIDFHVRWAIRRGPANGGVTQDKLLLGSTAMVEWAVIRYRSDIVDPDTYDFLEPPAADQALTFALRKQLTLEDVRGSLQLTISDVPMGVTFPKAFGKEIVIDATDEVHIGGCTDAYAHQLSSLPSTTDFSELTDEEPLVSGTGLTSAGATDVMNLNIDTGIDVTPRSALVIQEGEYAGSYRIITAAENTTSVQIDTVLANPIPGVRFYVTSLIRLNLTAPKVHKIDDGVALKTVIGSKVVTDLTQNFSLVGVAVGDTLEILSGFDQGTYLIAEVTTDTTLTLDTALQASLTGLSYKVYTALETVAFPLRRVTKVDLLDAGGGATGLTVPYADPVDIRTTQLVNVGKGQVYTDEFHVYEAGALRSTAGIDYSLLVARGDVLTIAEGPNAGQYVVGAAYYSVISLHSLLPLREQLPYPVVSFSYTITFDSGPFEVGEAIYFGDGFGSESGTVLSNDVGNGILTLQLSGIVQGAPTVGGLIKGMTSETQATVDEIFSSVTATVGSASTGSARCYFLEPTMFEARDRGAASQDTALFESPSGAMYAPDYRMDRDYLEFTDTSSDAVICKKLFIVTYENLVGGPFTVGEEVLLNAGANFMEVVYDDGVDTLWLADTDSATPPAATDALEGVDSSATADVVVVALDDNGDPGFSAALVSLATDAGDTHFQAKDVEVYDQMTPRAVPLTGTVDLVAGADINGVSFTLSVDDGPTQTIIFTGTNPVPLSQVSPTKGIVQQINSKLTGLTAEVTTVLAAEYLTLHSALKITIGSSGAGNTLLGFTAGGTNEVAAANTGPFWVKQVLNKNVLLLQTNTETNTVPSNLVTEKSVKFKLTKQGVQRIGPKEMALQKENGLYYVDVEIRSLYPGDEFNLAEGTALTVANHRSYGYRLTSRNDALTFSSIEEVDLEVTPLVLDPLLEDQPENATTVAGKDIRVAYDQDNVVGSAQGLLVLDHDRVVCNNPLAKVMLPAYVYTTINYTGGSKAALVKQDILDLANGTQSTVDLEVAGVYSILTHRNANTVQGPIELVAVRHNVDRTIDTIRSKDRLAVGRTAHLIAEAANISVTRS